MNTISAARVIDLDRLDVLYRAYRPHRTLAAAVRHVPMALLLFGSLLALATAPIWVPIIERNGVDLRAPATWLVLAILAPVYFILLWFQYEIVALIVSYSRYFMSRRWVAFTQILFALLIAWLAIYFVILFVNDSGLYWAASVHGVLATLSQIEHRSQLVTLIVMTPLATIVCWIAADIIVGSVRLAFTRNQEFAAIRGPTPRWSQLFKVRAISGGTPFYLAFGKSRKRGAFLLGVANVISTMLVLVVVAFVIYGVPMSMFLYIPVTAVFAPDPVEFLSGMNIRSLDIAGYEVAAPVVAVAMVVVAVCLLWVAVAGLLALGGAVGRFARKRLTTAYDETRAHDERAPILFLRSFKNDQVDLPLERTTPFDRIVPKFTEPTNLDQALLVAATPYGPVVAIGRPGEPAPPFGASRKYVADDDWQSVVRDVARESRRIVIVIDATGGVIWERDMVAEADLVSKTIFFFDPAASREERENLIMPILNKHNVEMPRTERMLVSAFVDPNGALCLLHARRATRSNHIVALNWALLSFGYPGNAWNKPALSPR